MSKNIKNLLRFEKCARDICEKFVYRIRYKLACFLRNLQTSRANNLRILKIKKAKFSGFVFIRTQTYWEIFKSAVVYL